MPGQAHNKSGNSYIKLNQREDKSNQTYNESSQWKKNKTKTNRIQMKAVQKDASALPPL